MSGTKLKGAPRGARLLQRLADADLIGKQALLAQRFGVSEGTICAERKRRQLHSAQ